jgi:hypothetical protein
MARAVVAVADKWRWRWIGGREGGVNCSGCGGGKEMAVEVARLVAVGWIGQWQQQQQQRRAQTTINQIWTKINYIFSFPN